MQPRCGHGFVEHGHARGTQALIVECSPGSRLSPADIAAQAAIGERIHFHLTSLNGNTAAHVSATAVRMRERGFTNLSACVLPGEILGLDTLAYESTMRVTEEHGCLVTAASLDPRLASVSVHYWPGSGMLDVISNVIRADRGLFLVLRAADIGHAKVYLQGCPQSRWSIVHDYPLNDIESAEFDEMQSGVPRGEK